MRTVKQRFPDFYGDVAITKLKDHFISAAVFNATDISLSHAIADMQVLAMNANANNGPLLNSLGALTARFEPLNFDSLEQRYSQCRPMGMKVDFIISLPDAATTPNTPLVFACFPYQNLNGQYGNYWNGTTVPDLQLSVDSIGQMKYGATRRLYSSGSKPVLRFSKYFSFPKIVGRTHDQFLSDANFQYDAATTNPPLCPINLACVISDMITGATVRNYNVEFFVTQYVRMEAAKLNPR